MTELGEWDRVNEAVYAKSTEEAKEAYTKWATKYDEDLNALKFLANESLVEGSFDLIKNDESSSMLDVAAGTGRTAVAFRNAGYKGKIDAIEMNAGMLEVARQKGLYRKFICETVTASDPLPVDDKTYDIAVIGGALYGHHIPQGCIPHIVNTLKVGGLLIFNTRTTEQNGQYLKVLLDILDRLEKENTIVQVRSESVPYYAQNCRESGKPMMAKMAVYRRMQ